MTRANEVGELLSAIEQTQEELSHVYAEKRAAIRTASVAEMNRLTEREQVLVSLMETHGRQQQSLLRLADPAARNSTLEDLVNGLERPERDVLLERIHRTRQLMAANRRESWVLWIVTQQSLRFFGDVIDCIANRGHKTPVYSPRPGTERSVGGAIFDACA